MKKDSESLLSNWITFLSFIPYEMNEIRGLCYLRLCFVILLCLTEDNSFNQLIHQPNSKFNPKVYILKKSEVRRTN